MMPRRFTEEQIREMALPSYTEKKENICGLYLRHPWNRGKPWSKFVRMEEPFDQSGGRCIYFDAASVKDTHRRSLKIT